MQIFSTMCCQFLLEFHSDKTTEEDGSKLNQSDKAAVEKDKDCLQNLVRLGGTGEIYYDQLILFFLGPGGSGKSIVIDLLNAYTREYMKEKNGHNLGEPHVFLTMTPNDDNSIRMEINSGVTVNDEKDVTQRRFVVTAMSGIPANQEHHEGGGKSQKFHVILNKMMCLT